MIIHVDVMTSFMHAKRPMLSINTPHKEKRVVKG